MSLLMKVRKGIAIASFIGGKVYIDQPNEKQIVLYGAAAKSFAFWRNKLFLIEP